MKRFAWLALLVMGCDKLEPVTTPAEVTLSAPTVNRTVSNENPRVYTCSVQLTAAANGSPGGFVELLTLTRVIEIDGGVSTVTDPATRHFQLRRLYSGSEQSASDDFSATFPFTARFNYTLRYRDMNLRVDSTTTTARCG